MHHAFSLPSTSNDEYFAFVTHPWPAYQFEAEIILRTHDWSISRYVDFSTSVPHATVQIQPCTRSSYEKISEPSILRWTSVQPPPSVFWSRKAWAMLRFPRLKLIRYNPTFEWGSNRERKEKCWNLLNFHSNL